MKKAIILTSIILLTCSLKPAFSQINWGLHNYFQNGSLTTELAWHVLMNDPNCNIDYAEIIVSGDNTSGSTDIISYNTVNWPGGAADFLDATFTPDWNTYTSYRCSWYVSYKTGGGNYAEYEFDQSGPISSGPDTGTW